MKSDYRALVLVVLFADGFLLVLAQRAAGDSGRTRRKGDDGSLAFGGEFREVREGRGVVLE